MSRKTIVIGMFLVFSLLITVGSPHNASATYFTNRETVEVGSGTCDIDVTSSNIYSPAGGAGTTVSGNLTLPCLISELDTVNFTIYNGETSNITVNFTVNGVAIASSLNVVNGTTVTFNLSNYTTGGGATNIAYFAWSGNCSDVDDEYFNITIIADDATMTASYISSTFSYDERDLDTPEVGKEMAYSYMTVEDRIKGRNSLVFNITDVNVSLSYPSHAISRPYTRHVFATLPYGTTTTWALGYQKRAPYVYDMNYEDNEATIRVKSFETLTNVVDWTIDPTDDFYKDYFPNLNYDTLEIEKQGSDVDWEQGSIEIEDMTLTDGLTTFTFTWTPAQPVTPIVPHEEEAWYNQNIGPIPAWSVIAIIIVATLVIIGVTVYKPNER